MNTAVLLKAKAAILENPYAFVMGAYVASRGAQAFCMEVKEPEKNICGTAACIAGTIVAITDNVNLLDIPGVNPMYASCPPIADRAEQILGIKAPAIFDITDWPSRLSKAYRNAKTDLARAQVAALAIDEYIADPVGFATKFKCLDMDEE